MTTGPPLSDDATNQSGAVSGHCYFHPGERALPTDFRQCFECGHSYRTEQELREAAEEVYGDTPVPATNQIWACPVCAHDF